MTNRIILQDNTTSVDTPDGLIPNVGSYFRKEQQGQNSPKDVRGHRILRPNPYVLNLTTHTQGIGVWNNPSIGIYREHYGTFRSIFGGVYYPSLSPSEIDRKRLKALDKLVTKAKGHEFNAAVFLAEANESVKMIGDTAFRIARSMSLLRRARFSDAIATLTGKVAAPTQIKSLNKRMQGPRYSTDKAFADNVLAVQYGWRPLLNDAAAAAHALEITTNRSWKQTTRYTQHFRVEVDGLTIFGVHCGKRTFVERITWDVVNRADFGSKALLREFGFLDPELVLWEKIPFSFVADWFIPVGSYLSTRAAIPSIEGSGFTTRMRSERARNPQPGGGYTWDGLYGASEVIMTRELGAIAGTSVPLPEFKNPFSVEHALNGISLLTSIFRHGSGSANQSK